MLGQQILAKSCKCEFVVLDCEAPLETGLQKAERQPSTASECVPENKLSFARFPHTGVKSQLILFSIPEGRGLRQAKMP
jgi:hypothetical protein